MIERFLGYRVRNNLDIAGMVGGSILGGAGLVLTEHYKDYQINALPVPHLLEGTGAGLLVSGGLTFLLGLQHYIKEKPII